MKNILQLLLLRSQRLPRPAKAGFAMTLLGLFLIFPSQAFAQLAPGEVECKPTAVSTGYFIAYFEEVALGNGEGYDDPTIVGPKTRGQIRQEAVCTVLVDLANLLNLEGTHVKPEIIFIQNPTNTGGSIPPNALAAASSFFSNGFSNTTTDNGDLYKHIMTGQDPVTGFGNFDAFVITNFYGSIQWDVDSNLNSGTYNFYSVMTHEILHALGFRSLLPAVIGQTNVAASHGTFDLNLYENTTPSIPFFNPTDQTLQVSTGAPPVQFISGLAVYDGKLNAPGAILDGDRPLYTPSNWQPGSSLSHFDSGRPPYTTYVMHPSIPTNTVKSIHNDEKQVLCHMGYAVTGMANCDLFTPIAMDDPISLTPGSALCVKPLANDISYNTGAALVMDQLDPANVQPGDSIIYFSDNNCASTTLPSAQGAGSFQFIAAAGSGPRIMPYKILDPVSNRISSQAKIGLLSCDVPADEYVCNGDLEMTQTSTYADCGYIWDPMHVVPFWCNQAATPDFLPYSVPYFPWTTVPFQCVNCNGGAMFINIGRTNGPGWDFMEGLLGQLKSPLVAGEQYILSFDVFAIANSSTIGTVTYDPTLISSAFIVAQLNAGPQLTASYNYIDYPLPDQVIMNQPVSFNVAPNTFTHITQTFTPNGNYDFLGIHGDYVAGGNQSVQFAFDNFSVKKVSAGLNSIKGKAYHDQNVNGVMDGNEAGLSGIKIGLFQPGQTTPVMAATQNAPYLGDYEFNNLSDGTYYVALTDENTMPLITQPGINGGLIQGYFHPYAINVVGGQIINNNDFGVQLVEAVSTDIAITKTVDTQMLSGGFVLYAINVSNSGPADVINVFANDLLPNGVTYVSHSISGGTYNSQTGLITIGSLNSGQTVTLQILAAVDKSAQCMINNTVHLLNSDTNSSNNNVTASFDPDPNFACTDIAVKKEIFKQEGPNIIYHITVMNNGPEDALNVAVEDPLPSNVVFQSANASSGTPQYKSAKHTVYNTFPSLLSGATADMYIRVNVKGSISPPVKVVNTVSFTGLIGNDTDPSNNSSTVMVIVGK